MPQIDRAPTPSSTVPTGAQTLRSACVDLTMTTRQSGARAVIDLAGEVDIYTAPRLREEIARVVATGSYDVIVDLSGVEFLDSSGLHTLVGGLKKVRAHDGSLRLVGARERVLKIFRITHLTKVFDLQDTAHAPGPATP